VSTSATPAFVSTAAVVDLRRLIRIRTAGSNARATKTARMVPEIGRVTKPVGSPPNINSDRRELDSMIEPRTKANTIGPGSKPAFFIK
jgi:hypothetical protein